MYFGSSPDVSSVSIKLTVAFSARVHSSSSWRRSMGTLSRSSFVRRRSRIVDCRSSIFCSFGSSASRWTPRRIGDDIDRPAIFFAPAPTSARFGAPSGTTAAAPLLPWLLGAGIGIGAGAGATAIGGGAIGGGASNAGCRGIGAGIGAGSACVAIGGGAIGGGSGAIGARFGGGIVPPGRPGRGAGPGPIGGITGSRAGSRAIGSRAMGGSRVGVGAGRGGPGRGPGDGTGGCGGGGAGSASARLDAGPLPKLFGIATASVGRGGRFSTGGGARMSGPGGDVVVSLGPSPSLALASSTPMMKSPT
jgi:hypothetical protein